MRILIVEDELDSLNEIVDYLGEYDSSIEIEACCNPLTAIGACQVMRFDAALLDIQMPEMSGFELAECLSAMNPDISLALITAYNNFATEAFDLNAVDYILKPIRQERFNKALDKIKKDLAEKQKMVSSAHCELIVQAFGKMIVSCDDTILKWKRQKSSEIFAYLLHQHGSPVHKEKLCEMMWPEYDPQKALTYLQTIMYQLRKNIAEIGSNCLTIEFADHCYRLILHNVRYDVDLFLDACDQAFRTQKASLEALMKAEQLYKGAYFEEDGWIWAFGRQQTLARLYQRVLERIIQIEMQRQNKKNVLFYLQKLAALDSYQNEEAYLTWVRNYIGAEEAEKLEAIFVGDK